VRRATLDAAPSPPTAAKKAWTSSDEAAAGRAPRAARNAVNLPKSRPYATTVLALMPRSKRT
jgi:hypothetical protein